MKFCWESKRNISDDWFPVKWKLPGANANNIFVERSRWCRDQASEGQVIRSHVASNLGRWTQTWYFEYESDALLFILKWGD